MWAGLGTAEITGRIGQGLMRHQMVHGEVPCGDPAATSVLHIHGLEDRAVPFVGGPGVSRNGVSRVDGRAVPAVIALWREAGERGAATTVDRGDPLVVDERADCAGGVTVELITIADAGHQWPGSAVVRVGADPPSDRLDATAVIWEFFRAAECGGDLAWGQREAAEGEDCGDGAFPGGEVPFEAP